MSMTGFKNDICNRGQMTPQEFISITVLVNSKKTYHNRKIADFWINSKTRYFRKKNAVATLFFFFSKNHTKKKPRLVCNHFRRDGILDSPTVTGI